MSKLQINNAKKLRHYWNTDRGSCDCGNKVRLLIYGRWICKDKLIEQLNDLGYSVEKNYEGCERQ